jgi:hypothetical protein
VEVGAEGVRGLLVLVFDGLLSGDFEGFFDFGLDFEGEGVGVGSGRCVEDESGSVRSPSAASGTARGGS